MKYVFLFLLMGLEVFAGRGRVPEERELTLDSFPIELKSEWKSVKALTITDHGVRGDITALVESMPHIETLKVGTHTNVITGRLTGLQRIPTIINVFKYFPPSSSVQANFLTGVLLIPSDLLDINNPQDREKIHEVCEQLLAFFRLFQGGQASVRFSEYHTLLVMDATKERIEFRIVSMMPNVQAQIAYNPALKNWFYNLLVAQKLVQYAFNIRWIFNIADEMLGQIDQENQQKELDTLDFSNLFEVSP